jgi:hypothetical protein
MAPEVLTVLIAAAAGFLTSLSIEVFKAFNENVKSKQQRANRELFALRRFLAPDAFDTNRPIARLLISRPYKIRHVKRIIQPCKEISSIAELSRTMDREEAEEGPPMQLQTPARMSAPQFSMPVCRRYYRRDSDNPDYAYVWQIRERVRFLGEITTIGRSSQNDVVLDDSQLRLRLPKVLVKDSLVSRHHAVIRYEVDKFVIYDLAATNPTEVNDGPVRYAVLMDGDIIGIGSFLLEFQQCRSTT